MSKSSSRQCGDATVNTGAPFDRCDDTNLLKHQPKPSLNHGVHLGFRDFVGAGGEEVVPVVGIENDSAGVGVVVDPRQ